MADKRMDSAILETTSQQFLGQWKRLVSTTNWDKGRIIQQWRAALVEAGIPAAEYSDETWSRQVGSVTPQHVGRLRRVFERFGEVCDGYDGLYWSHFQAALDWNDAEMWLEGAVQNGWSISEMRRTRWETLGAPAELKPRDEDIVSSDLDEDVDSAAGEESMAAGDEPLSGKVEQVRPALKAGSAASDTDYDDLSHDGESAGADYDAAEPDSFGQAEPVRPFANLASLPADVSESFESFKLCILKHKLAGWTEIARGDLVAALEALKELAVAPAGD
jgi:hypothetical protein